MTVSRTTDFYALCSSTSTTQQFVSWGGTQPLSLNLNARSESEPASLVEWLATPQARQYEGQWVLLSDDFEVLDNGRTLTELIQRNPGARTPIIVFVDPANTNLIA